jgi:hypothetical protein
VVTLRGSIANPTVNTLITLFNAPLPAYYVPSAEWDFAAVVFPVGVPMLRGIVQPNGQVLIQSAGSTTVTQLFFNTTWQVD